MPPSIRSCLSEHRNHRELPFGKKARQNIRASYFLRARDKFYVLPATEGTRRGHPGGHIRFPRAAIFSPQIRARD